MFRAVTASLRAGECDPDPPRGREPARARADAASDGRRADSPGNEGDAAPPGTTALPIGLTFHEPETFRTGWALVLVGAPVPVDDCRAIPRPAEPERAVRSSRPVAEALREVIVESRIARRLRLAEGLEAIRRAERRGRPGGRWTIDVARGAGGVGPGAPRVPIGGSRLARPVAARALSAPRSKLPADLERAVCRRAVVGARIHRGRPVATRALHGGLALLGGRPLAAWGCWRATRFRSWLTSARRAAARERPGRRRRHGQADRRRRPLSRLLGPRGLGRRPAAPAAGGLTAPSSWDLIPTGLLRARAAQARLARVRRDARAFLRFLFLGTATSFVAAAPPVRRAPLVDLRPRGRRGSSRPRCRTGGADPAILRDRPAEAMTEARGSVAPRRAPASASGVMSKRLGPAQDEVLHAGLQQVVDLPGRSSGLIEQVRSTARGSRPTFRAPLRSGSLPLRRQLSTGRERAPQVGVPVP